MYNFTSLEKDVSNYWQTFHTFRLSNSRRQGKQFVFYDGPPFATGTPHYGHLLVGTIKDAVARYKNMSGYSVPRQWGWDCHGVPVETLVQNKLNLTRIDALQNDKVHEFNEECRNSVLLCADQWRDIVNRMGRWVDFDHSYKTMDKNYMESVWWVFKQLFDQGRVYQAKKVMPYSCKLQTTLSKHEMMDSYREVEDPYVIVKFQLVDEKDTYFLAYTTTPWTLPTNTGLCVNPDEEYSFVVCNSETYVLASKLVGRTMWDMKYQVKKTVTGAQLLGTKYQSLFSFQHYQVVTDDFVTVDDGTGVVHLAPAFGEDDYRVGQKYNLSLLDYLDAEGKFSDACPEYKGLFVKDADKEVIHDLSMGNKVFKTGKLKHDYPFCERTGVPLIYRAVNAWYVRLEDVKDRLLKNNAEVNWVPQSVGSNRFANWLKEAKDWNVSRNRLWGCCLPLWVSNDGDVLCVGSVNELEELSGVAVFDLHKDILDKVTITKDGKEYHRVPEVLDCWFESGCMPYAQHHYPFENKELVESNFPADFIVEGLDQTRGWFYTLLVLGTLLFDKCPFKNVVVNGMVLAEDGTKMSKSKKNYTDPTELLDTYGADAVRAYFLSSVATVAEPMLFKDKDLQNIVKSLMLPLNNALDFYKLYSTTDNWFPAKKDFTPGRELDEWILAELNQLMDDTTQHMEAYEIAKVLPKVAIFLDKLCNWYIRLSRKLFWEEGVSSIKNGAYHTLHCVLFNLVRLLAPFMPFMTEQMYCDLGHRGSVHWEDYPRAFVPTDREKDLLDRMKLLRTLSSMGHNLRVKSNIKVRQPLSKMFISGIEYLTHNDRNLLKEELNLKGIILQRASNRLTAKANFRSLGKRCGKDMPQVAKAIAALSTQELQSLQKEPLTVAGYQVSLEDVLITQLSDSEFPTEILDNLSVSLDTTLTPELIEEGDVRELCSVVQSQRKSMKLHMTDRVCLVWNSEDTETFNFMRKWGSEVEEVVLANRSVFHQDAMQGTKVSLSCGNLYFLLKRD